MKACSCVFLGAGFLLTAIAIFAGDDALEEAAKKDHRLIEGTWKIVTLEVKGNKAKAEDAEKLTVVNGSDGTWSLRSEGKEIAKGASTIDPTQRPKTIDIMPTDGDDKGTTYLGIYELGEKTRKLCFAPPDKARPMKFSSAPESGHILVVFQREKPDA